MRQALDVVHVPYPNKFRHFANDMPTDEETISRDVINWIENRLFKTTTPPEEVAGIVLEVVQGEGGYIPAPKQFVKELRRICDENGIMLIVDEVQSGMGRTGKMFALDHHEGVKADIMCLAKGLGSGMPIGACIARADIMDWHKGAHASTFGGNPVALAAALKTIELLQGGMVDNSARSAAYLEGGTRKTAGKIRLHRRRSRPGNDAWRRICDGQADSQAGCRASRPHRDGMLQTRPDHPRLRLKLDPLVAAADS